MSASPVLHVLNLLRAIRADAESNGQGRSASNFVQVHFGQPPSSPEFLRSLLSIQSNLRSVQAVLELDDRIDGEGKDGLLQQIAQLRLMFSTDGLNTNIHSFIPNLAVAVSQFSLISGFFSDVSDPFSRAGAEFDDLIFEMERLIGVVDASELDGEARASIISNINALKLFVSNIRVFGFDATYSAYFDIVINLRKRGAKRGASDTLGSVWGEVERWAGRLAILEGVVSNSQALLTAADAAVRLIPSS